MPDMLSEWVYRRLLVSYPREHRREYEEPMVQLFRDRMRRDGGGFRGTVVWTQMMFDLVGAAFKEHKEGADMRKLAGIGIALAVVLVAGGIGIGTLLAQSKGDVAIAVIQDEDTKSFTATGAGGIVEAMRQAVEDGAIGQEAADEIVLAFEDGDGPADAWRYEFGADGAAEALRQAVEEGEIAQTTADAIVQIVDGRFERGLEVLNGARVFVLEDAETLTFSEAGPGDVAETLRQAVEAGSITPGQVNEIVLSLEGDGPANVWRYDGGADGVAGAVRQAVEDGVISEALADWILRSFDG